MGRFEQKGNMLCSKLSFEEGNTWDAKSICWVLHPLASFFYSLSVVVTKHNLLPRTLRTHLIYIQRNRSFTSRFVGDLCRSVKGVDVYCRYSFDIYFKYFDETYRDACIGKGRAKGETGLMKRKWGKYSNFVEHSKRVNCDGGVFVSVFLWNLMLICCP